MLRILPIALLAFIVPMSVDGAWIVQPESVELSNRFDQTQLIVREQNTNGQVDDRSADGTSMAKYESLNETIVRVDERGRAFPVMDGSTQLRIQIANETLTIPVTVSGMMEETTIKFVKDVAPILSKAGCNMGACHASQYGKGGFKLSVFGFEPSTITR